MNISEFQYLWTTEKNDYVLTNSEFGYGIINQKTHMIPCISDEEEEEIVIGK